MPYNSWIGKPIRRGWTSYFFYEAWSDFLYSVCSCGSAPFAEAEVPWDFFRCHGCKLDFRDRESGVASIAYHVEQAKSTKYGLSFACFHRKHFESLEFVSRFSECNPTPGYLKGHKCIGTKHISRFCVCFFDLESFLSKGFLADDDITYLFASIFLGPKSFAMLGFCCCKSYNTFCGI